MARISDPFYLEWADWFNQPEKVKQKHLRTPERGGWYPPMSETPGYTGNRDPKEYFHYRHNHLGMSVATDKRFWEGYQRCYNFMNWIGLRYLASKVRPEYCVLRILKYFDTGKGIYGEGHKDFNLLTCAFPGTRPGLQYLCHGEWWDVEHILPAVHPGEMLEIYSSGQYQATPHRVYSEEPGERYTSVFFYLPPEDLELKTDYTAADYLKETLTKAGTYDIGRK